jgi:predicted tellurium resistance membrane protein TerC
VFNSNVFAILGMRAMYSVVAGIVPRFHLLKYVLGLILVFVGLKMAWLNEAFDGKLTITWSLGIILSILAIAASLLFGALGPSRP